MHFYIEQNHSLLEYIHCHSNFLGKFHVENFLHSLNACFLNKLTNVSDIFN